jgi:Putative Ig domain
MMPRASHSSIARLLTPFVLAVTSILTLPAIAAPKRGPNSPPVISGSAPSAVTVGTRYEFTPSATDPDGDALTFRIRNRPNWASFDRNSGRLYGAPASPGTWPGVQITVSDGRATASLPQFTIDVTSGNQAAVNRAPTITGTPATQVEVNRTYEFRPTASDPDGDTLTFSIQNRPAWANFDATTGRLWGTPSSQQGGTYANVAVAVSDGNASAALPAFSIAVTEPAQGSASLSWRAPTTNTDGSPLSDLAGFRVYYGYGSRSYSQSLSIPSPSVTSVLLESLPAGTWYFAVKAYTSSGVESDYSPEASKFVQ